MPLDWKKFKPLIKNGVWIIVFAAAYILMQKAMHPGWTIIGY